MTQMHPTNLTRQLLTVACAVGFAATACSSTATQTPAGSSGSASASGAFPVSVTAAHGTIPVVQRPSPIASLSPTATAILYALRAGAPAPAGERYSTSTS